MAKRRTPRLTESERIPGAFEGETVTRRRFMTSTVHISGAIATSAIVLPAIGFAVGPVFDRPRIRWQGVGPVDRYTEDTFVSAVIDLTTDSIGEAGKTTVYIRKRNPAIDTERSDKYSNYLAISSRCVHVGCPVHYVDAAQSFVCPCHGGVYNFRGQRTGGPPPRPLDRFFTRVRDGQLEIGPRFSVNSALKRFSPRDPGEILDGIGPLLYPPRLTTEPFPK